MQNRLLLAAVIASACATSAWASNLDLTASYNIRGLSYSNLNLNSADKNNHSFVSNDARLGFAVRKIYLESRGGEDTTMDVTVSLHALGVAGSTVPLVAPFNKAAENYPRTDFAPFLENANISVHQLFGLPMETTFGRQNFKLGSGLVLDDDGAGFTGITARAALPWWDVHVQGFIFSGRESFFSQNYLGLYGGTIELPSEGTWQLNQLFERDRANQTVYGCNYPGMPPEGCVISQARKSFTSVRYQINYGPMVFDGEAALERGVGTPTFNGNGSTPLGTHIVYSGDAEVVRAKWKQSFYRMGEGIARVSVGRGSGDDPGSPTKDEAFFPSHGHRFDGLERSGFGDFFGASPYDAFGGNYSTSTASGLRKGASGIVAVGGGFTPPSYKGIILDVDYYLYQAERVDHGSRTLGGEWDIHLRYAIEDRFTLSASAALFGIGSASNVNLGKAKKYTVQASGRF